MTFPRLGARSTPSITLEGVERAVELTSWKITSEDDDETLVDPNPEQVYYLEGEAYQSTASGSLWGFTRHRSGDVVAFTVRPHGNAIPTVDQPHYVGDLVVGPKPALGGDSGARWFPFAFVWRILGEPLEVTEPLPEQDPDESLDGLYLIPEPS
ncbi:hypothetical protein LQ938_09710 [Microbacterium sp. cx-55]|uniref:hypothetical protein n=1 Tax=Microbacterium sp. cx-55 TaxID=2875948 RepID=UPI001CC0F574|nr:hypothetical protein [Microbacterium sp. cx-55]MBZ4485963.1 hypothetical protein [Microbacterium sp. cx-55]UGB34163.1 hypothetical protein LQ938_09710 [Microbacterium sp. cx-55]